VGPQIHQIFDSSITGAIGQKVQLEIIATGEDLEYTWYLMNPMIGYPEVIQQGSSNVLELTLTEDIAGYYINCTIKDAYGEAVNDGWAEIILNGRTVVDQGTCGETMTWVLLDDGSLEISGLGDMYDYDPSTGNDAPWNAYSKQITCVRMEDLVHIGDNAFCDLGLLEVVEIPLSVESIGTNAFAAGLAIEVRYAGTETHWSHVAGRETLAGCQITYCYGAPDLWDSLVEISEDNYVLVEDVIALASDLELPAGATLDLRGKSMSISNLVSFGSIIDTVGGGILQAQDYVFGQNGAYMPIYDAEVDGYQFFNWDLESLGTRTNAEGVTFGTALVFENAQAYELLLQGNTGLRVSVKLSWEGGEQTFVFSDEMLGNYADLQMRYCDLVAALMLTVTGVDALESGAQLTVTPSVSAADGQWSATGLAMTYTKA